MSILDHPEELSAALEDADAATLRHVRILLTEGSAALERTVILECRPARRRKLLTSDLGYRYLLGVFPGGAGGDSLPERWLTEAVDANWARWYMERPDGR